MTRIRATIHVERDSQKMIVIGKSGQKLKEIGTAARREIERMTGNKVFLEIFVRVQKKWTKDPEALKTVRLRIGEAGRKNESAGLGVRPIRKRVWVVLGLGRTLGACL